MATGFDYGMGAAACEYDGINRYIRITDIDEESHHYIADNPVSPSGTLDNKYLVKENDILFARTGASTGKSYLYRKTDGKLYFAGFLIRASVSPEYDSRFVFDCTLTRRYNNWVRLTSMRSGQPGINSQEYSGYKSFFPPLAEQKRIADLFEYLDLRISKQHQLIESLKSYKRGVLSAIFPQTGDTIPEYRLKGFSDTWTLCRVGEIAGQTYGGGTPKTSIESYWHGDIPWIQSSNVAEHELFRVDIQKYVTKLGVQESATQLIPKDSIAVVSHVGVGKLVFMPLEYTTSQDFISLSGLKTDPVFTCYALYKRLQEDAHIVQGSAIKGITKETLLNKEIAIPSRKEQIRIGFLIKQIDNLISLQQNKCESLLSTKQSLLQQMFI